MDNTGQGKINHLNTLYTCKGYILSKSENLTVQSMFSCLLGYIKTMKDVWIIFPRHLANDWCKAHEFYLLISGMHLFTLQI